jgi:VCBS repeat-containing protein
VGGSATVLNNDTGQDDTPVTVSLVNDVSNGSLTLNNDGTFTYDHDGSENFSDSFTYRVTDNDGQTADATVNINIDPVNDSPIASDTRISVTEDSVYTGTLPPASDEEGDSVTYGAESDPAHGQVTVNEDGSFSYTPDVDFHGADSFIYSVNDGNGGVNSYLVEIDVVALNDAPNITSHGEAESVLLSLEENNVLVTTVDAVDPENDTLSFSIDGGTDLGLFSIDAVSGELVFINPPDSESPLDSDQDNLYQVEVLVSDGNGGTDRQAFTVEVTDVDEFDVGLLIDIEDSPDMISYSSPLNGEVGITAWAEDPDSGNNRITYSLDEDADGLFAIDPSTGVVTLVSIPENLDVSQYEITVRATSEDGSYSMRTFSIALSGVVEPPSEPEESYLDDIISDLYPPQPTESVTQAEQLPSQTEADTEAESSQESEESGMLSQIDQKESNRDLDETDLDILERFGLAMFSPENREHNNSGYFQARLTPDPVPPDELPAFNTMSGELIEVPKTIWSLLDVMGRDMFDHRNEQVTSDGVVLQSATVSTFVLSAGYVAWLLRAGVLSASLLSSTPLWRQVDPLPVLSARGKKREQERKDLPEDDPQEKRLVKLFERMNKQNRPINFRKKT